MDFWELYDKISSSTICFAKNLVSTCPGCGKPGYNPVWESPPGHFIKTKLVDKKTRPQIECLSDLLSHPCKCVHCNSVAIFENFVQLNDKNKKIIEKMIHPLKTCSQVAEERMPDKELVIDFEARMRVKTDQNLRSVFG
jgi:hypothetical protein